MKKILFSLVALVCSMSMNAQVVMKIMKGETVVATYTAEQADKVVFEEESAPTIGTAKATIGVSETYVKWVQLWKNGPKFAEYNVGATSVGEYGGYYCWGKSIDKDSSGSHNEGPDALTGSDDTATNLWGRNWRMPTDPELQALVDNCDVAWTDDYKGDGTNIEGCIFTGKGDYKDNSIFLPATGNNSYGNLLDQGSLGYYWTSSPTGIYGAYVLNFSSDFQAVGNSGRDMGYSVRAVLTEL